MNIGEDSGPFTLGQNQEIPARGYYYFDVDKDPKRGEVSIKLGWLVYHWLKKWTDKFLYLIAWLFASHSLGRHTQDYNSIQSDANVRQTVSSTALIAKKLFVQRSDHLV